MGKVNHPDQLLDRLLAAGRLSGPEKERILQAVLDGHSPSRDSCSRERRGWFGGHPGRRPILLAAAALLLLAAPTAYFVARWSRIEKPDLRPKGPQTDAPLVEARCDGPCRPGATLLFRIQGHRTRVYLAAWAQDEAGRRIWYFPSPGTPMPRVEPGTGPVLVAEGVRLGHEHALGKYIVTVVLSRRPLGREALLGAQSGQGDVLARTITRFEIR